MSKDILSGVLPDVNRIDSEPPGPVDISLGLRYLVPEDGSLEVRAIRPAHLLTEGEQKSRIRNFDSPCDLDRIASFVNSCSGFNVYFGLNPRMRSRDERSAGKHEHVLRRRLLLIDVDPARPSDTNSTGEEKAGAYAIARRIFADLKERGWPPPLVIDSGNGFHLLFRIDQVNDGKDGSVSRTIKDALIALGRRFDSSAAHVDKGVFDPARIARLPGTLNVKGPDQPDRPQRWTRVLWAPEIEDWQPVNWELVCALAGGAEEDRGGPSEASGSAEGEASTHIIPGWARGKAVNGPDKMERARAYLAKVDPAISGQEGHKTAFRAACSIGPGFDLEPGEAYRLLAAEYNHRCVPPWSEQELRHKVEDAYKEETRRGWLLNEDRSKGKRASSKLGDGHQPDTEGISEPDEDGQVPLKATDDPHRLARLFLASRSHPDGLTLRYFQGDWFHWTGNRFRRCPEKEIRARLTTAAEVEFNRHARAKKAQPVTTKVIANVLQALMGETCLCASEIASVPSWIGNPPVDWEPKDILPCRNGLLHLPSLASGGDCLLPHSPLFFAEHVLGYDFCPDLPAPELWMRFLKELWPNDTQSIECLQEWFGYLLTRDTAQQKMLVIIGPPRSGKGTISRILRQMIGEENICCPTLTSIVENFGLEPVIGKQATVINDARLSGRTNTAPIVERLLSITGEDAQCISRKHKLSWEGKLSTRFVLISNELPQLDDASNALVKRMIVLNIVPSFFGKEDHGLYDKLTRELPGILQWSIDGWKRLRERGYFIQPESGRELLEGMEELSNPVGPFLQERCLIGPDQEIETKELFTAWKKWCLANGRSRTAGTAQGFAKDLRAAIPGLHSRGTTGCGISIRKYVGIGLIPEAEEDEEEEDDIPF